MTETTKVCICRKGCGLRGLDGARLENYFRANGCLVLEDPKDADLIILLTCAYQESKEEESFDLIKELGKYKGELVVAGCLPEISPTRFKKEFGGVALAPKSLWKIDRLFPSFEIKFREVADANVPLPLVGNSKKDVRGLPPVIRVAKGCLGNCSYCAIRFAVGKLKSKPIDVCETEYKTLLGEGHRCFLLNAEDVGSYGLDIGSSLPELLDRLYEVDRRSDIQWKLFTINPRSLIGYKSELANYVRKGRIVDLQSDVQSGSKRILTLMNRHYEIEKVIESFGEMRKANSSIYLRTICLVGFPSETEEDFLKTLSVMKQLDLNYILVIPYSDRELTTSSTMHSKISKSTVEKRVELAREYFGKNSFSAYRDSHATTLMKSVPPCEG